MIIFIIIDILIFFISKHLLKDYSIKVILNQMIEHKHEMFASTKWGTNNEVPIKSSRKCSTRSSSKLINSVNTFFKTS